MKKVLVKVVNKSDNPLPKYKTEGSAGCDLYSSENMTIPIGAIRLVKTELYTQIPEGYEVQIRSCYGMALKHGVFVLNAPGAISSDHRNGWGVILMNMGDYDFDVKEGDRIAQAVISEAIQIDWDEVNKLSESGRGKGGFGSTGI